jgi:hypothetical protein
VVIVIDGGVMMIGIIVMRREPHNRRMRMHNRLSAIEMRMRRRQEAGTRDGEGGNQGDSARDGR